MSACCKNAANFDRVWNKNFCKQTDFLNLIDVVKLYEILIHIWKLIKKKKKLSCISYLINKTIKYQGTYIHYIFYNVGLSSTFHSS